MSMSQAHSEAARRNGAHSQGPISEEGRRRSSQNARKHSFFASYSMLPGEDREEFDALLLAYLQEYTPATLTESHFVHDLADSEWRLQRVRGYLADLQTNVMSKFQARRTPAEAFHHLAKEGPTLSLLLRYETKFQRQYEKALQQLLMLQTRREKSAAAQTEPAAAGVPSQPAQESAPSPAPPVDPPVPADPPVTTQYSNNLQTPPPAAPATTTKLQNEPNPPEDAPNKPEKPFILHGRLIEINY